MMQEEVRSELQPALTRSVGSSYMGFMKPRGASPPVPYPAPEVPAVTVSLRTSLLLLPAFSFLCLMNSSITTRDTRTTIPTITPEGVVGEG